MKQVIFIFTLFFAVSSYAYMELGLNYGYRKQIVEAVDEDGEIDTEGGSAISETNSYSGSLSWYAFEQLALEFSYSESENIITDDRESTTENDAGTEITVKETVSTVKSTVQSVGLKLALASRKSVILPAISLGYAKLITKGTTSYQLEIDGVELDDPIEIDRDATEQDSSFAALSIRIKITQLLGLTIMGKTVMPNFDTSKAGNNVMYSAGLSWIF